MRTGGRSITDGPREATLPASACENCGAELLGGFCHSCGAPQVSERDLSIRRFAGEATQEITSVEHSKLLRTLRALLFRPGFLTKEYFSARRVRYVRPLALVLAVLALHLFAFSISNTVSMYDIGRQAAGEEKLLASMGIEHSEASRGLLLSSRIQAEAARRGVPAEAIEREIDDKWARNASLMQIPLIVLFSLALQLIHFRSRRYYVEHLVFSMHAISFAALTVVFLWPAYYWLGIELKAATLALAIGKYVVDGTWLVLATRTFYGHSLRKSVALGLLTYVAYYLAFFPLHQLAMTLALLSAFGAS